MNLGPLVAFSRGTTHILYYDDVYTCFDVFFCSTLDQVEMFDQQKVFKVEDYVKMSEFLNLFVFRILWNGLMGKLSIFKLIVPCLTYHMWTL